VRIIPAPLPVAPAVRPPARWPIGWHHHYSQSTTSPVVCADSGHNTGTVAEAASLRHLAMLRRPGRQEIETAPSCPEAAPAQGTQNCSLRDYRQMPCQRTLPAIVSSMSFRSGLASARAISDHVSELYSCLPERVTRTTTVEPRTTTSTETWPPRRSGSSHSKVWAPASLSHSRIVSGLAHGSHLSFELVSALTLAAGDLAGGPGSFPNSRYFS